VTEYVADLHAFKISHKLPNNKRHKIIENSSTWSQKIQFMSFRNHYKSNSMRVTMTVPSEQHCCLFYELYTGWPKHVAAMEPRGYIKCKSNRRQIKDVYFEK